jgi:hypothetical protein
LEVDSLIYPRKAGQAYSKLMTLTRKENRR